MFRTELTTLKRTPKINLKTSNICILCIKIRKEVLVLSTQIFVRWILTFLLDLRRDTYNAL